MRLPKRIDHRLVDTIIRVQFVPGVPPETVPGYVHSLWRDRFISSFPDRSPKLRVGLSDLLIEPQSTLFFLTNDNKFRIDVDGSAITFNSVSDYAGWDRLREVFNECIETLFLNGIVRQVERLGVRYINRFDQVRIFDHLDITVKIGGVVPGSNRQQVRAEFERNGFTSVLTLVNEYPAESVRSNTPSNNFFSLFDVDIIKFFDTNEPISYAALLSVLEDAHLEEKTIFFTLLNPDFLQTLNPLY